MIHTYNSIWGNFIDIMTRFNWILSIEKWSLTSHSHISYSCPRNLWNFSMNIISFQTMTPWMRMLVPSMLSSCRRLNSLLHFTSSHASVFGIIFDESKFTSQYKYFIFMTACVYSLSIITHIFFNTPSKLLFTYVRPAFYL